MAEQDETALAASDSPAEKAPFDSIAFLFNDQPHGRILLRITKADAQSIDSAIDADLGFDEGDDSFQESVGGIAYRMHFEIGSVDHGTNEANVVLSLEDAKRLQDRLMAAGVYLWDPEYGDDPDQPPAKWSLTAVLQEGVFTAQTRGGSDFPRGFTEMMVAFYEAGLPKPVEKKPEPQPAMGMGDFDMSKMMESMMQAMGSGIPAKAMQEMQEIMSEMQRDPDAFHKRLRSEFKQLSPAQQNELLNLLSSTGMGSRQWWDDFLRG